MSAVDVAFHGLRQMISSGRLAAGQKFPPEAELCEELGVSRGSLREAVRMLSALRVIDSRHGSGTYVARLVPEEIVGTLALTVDLLPLAGLLEIYELRRVLEAHATSQAAARITDEQGRELLQLLDRMEATSDGHQASELDALFHSTIAAIAGNPTLATLLDVFRSRSRSYQIFDTADGKLIKATSDAGHRSITNALIARDPAAAYSAAAQHVAQTEHWLRLHQPPVSGAPERSVAPPAPSRGRSYRRRQLAGSADNQPHQ
ncbi:DNA-binding transcriptional regulator, FadR family [Micromonospora rhizosphaerae]|uniref:DNA-binding transcriptional regulator, FadR family n=1 Tax=Micromonospora rhizosphaerae TaxID=568872 RepID=A0A1C6SBQ9_9ACTN|nr:FadR/GntR family transcriptional regulator [Micromonospora rhizosphaerae]SCL26835.1 DNA-binding transcriptional regulator, FadR family [Micromonospora rhizosphaerae]